MASIIKYHGIHNNEKKCIGSNFNKILTLVSELILLFQKIKKDHIAIGITQKNHLEMISIIRFALIL